jgi:hypothetical protein
VQDEETSAVLGQRGISTAKGREKGAKFEEAWSLEERRPGLGYGGESGWGDLQSEVDEVFGIGALEAGPFGERSLPLKGSAL